MGVSLPAHEIQFTKQGQLWGPDYKARQDIPYLEPLLLCLLNYEPAGKSISIAIFLQLFFLLTHNINQQTQYLFHAERGIPILMKFPSGETQWHQHALRCIQFGSLTGASSSRSNGSTWTLILRHKSEYSYWQISSGKGDMIWCTDWASQGPICPIAALHPITHNRIAQHRPCLLRHVVFLILVPVGQCRPSHQRY